MKKNLTLIFLLVLSGGAIAQPAKNTVKIGVLTSVTPYLQQDGVFGPFVQYDRTIKGRWGAGITLGGFSNTYGDLSFARGSDPNYPGKYAYTFEHREQVLFSDFQGTYSFFGRGRYTLKAGAGFSIVQSKLKTRITKADGTSGEYNFPSFIYFKDNMLQGMDYDRSQATLMMAGFVLENEFKLTKHFSLGLKGVYRTAFSERKKITQVISNNTSGAETYLSRGIRDNGSVSLSLGYLF